MYIGVCVVCAGPLPEEPGEQVCTAAEDRGSGEKAGGRERPQQDGEEEEAAELPGRHAEAAGDRGRDEPVPHQEGKEAHPEGLPYHSRLATKNNNYYNNNDNNNRLHSVCIYVCMYE